MSFLTKGSALWRTMFRRSQQEEKLRGELDAYLEITVKEKVEQGLSPSEAWREARIEFGGVEQVKEKVREVRMGIMIETLWQDTHYGLRMLRRNPGFTVVAILTLALGIGANTTVFTWINRVILDPIPGVEVSGSLVDLSISFRSDGRRGAVSFPNYESYRDRTTTMEGLVAHAVTPFSLVHKDATERVWGSMVSGNYFEVLGVKAFLGRVFSPEEGMVSGRDPVMVVSHALWQRSLGGDQQVIGKQVRVNGQPFTVIGVVPQEFRGISVGLNLDAWIPVTMEGQLRQSNRNLLVDRGDGWLSVKGKLKPGVTLDQARAEFDGIADQLSQEYPETNEDRGALLLRLRDSGGAQALLAPVLTILMGVVSLVLLIACANVASLLMARATARQKEIAVRRFLGAGRSRLVRQLMTESLLLSLLGGAAALLVAQWSSGLLNSLIPPIGLPLDLNGAVDTRVLLFTLVVATFSGLLFGLLPAWQASRTSLLLTLGEETSRATGGRRRKYLRSALVVVQVALSMILLVSAGLFIRSFRAAQTVNPGFYTSNLLFASIDLEADGYTRNDAHIFFRQLTEELNALPGVESAALGRYVPLSIGGRSDSNVEVEGYEPGPNERVQGFHTDITPGYFRTLGIPLLQGRDFTWQDNDESEKVVIITESMAKRYWEGGLALNGKIRRRDGEYSVVGVVADFKYVQLTEEPASIMLFPVYQRETLALSIHLRTSGDVAALTPALRGAIRSMDPDTVLFGVTTVERNLATGALQQRIAGSLLGVFGFLAILLASVGIYGVLAYLVSQRTHEIGIRMALGARQSDILRIVLRHGAALVGTGLFIGLIAAFGLSRVFASLLFGISQADPVAFVGAALVLVFAALLACYIPARRATKVDPMVAMRYE